MLLMAPVTAEYLIGYDDTIGSPAVLVFGILFFAPLYGAPAVLIREVARRTGRGWPTILLLAAAFGLIEAGLVDQSLFDPDYREIPYWQDLRQPTYLPWFHTSAFMSISFVAGHVFGSIAAPIALAESWWPDRSRTPWLGLPGLVTMAALWCAGSAFILGDQLSSTDFHISLVEGVGTAVVVVALVVVALRLPRDRGTLAGFAPSPWVVLAVSTVLLGVRSVVSTGWVPTVAAAGATVGWLVLVGRWSRQSGWSGVHVLAAVTGDLLSIGLPAFALTPLGDVPLAAKLTTNVVLLLLVLGVAWEGLRRERRWAATRPAPHEFA